MEARDQAMAIVMVCPVMAAAFRLGLDQLIVLCSYALTCLLILAFMDPLD